MAPTRKTRSSKKSKTLNDSRSDSSSNVFAVQPSLNQIKKKRKQKLASQKQTTNLINMHRSEITLARKELDRTLTDPSTT